MGLRTLALTWLQFRFCAWHREQLGENLVRVRPVHIMASDSSAK